MSECWTVSYFVILHILPLQSLALVEGFESASEPESEDESSDSDSEPAFGEVTAQNIKLTPKTSAKKPRIEVIKETVPEQVDTKDEKMDSSWIVPH